MKFVEVDPTGYAFNLRCKACNIEGDSSGKTGRVKQWYADTEGEPFQAYYCEGCLSDTELFTRLQEATRAIVRDAHFPTRVLTRSVQTQAVNKVFIERANIVIDMIEAIHYLKTHRGLVHDAALASELIDEDELERFAESQRCVRCHERPDREMAEVEEGIVHVTCMRPGEEIA